MFENMSASEEFEVQQPTVEVPRSKTRVPAQIEIDCTHPEIEIRVSPRHRRSITSSTTETSQRRSVIQLQPHRESQEHGSFSRVQSDTYSSSSRFEPT